MSNDLGVTPGLAARVDLSEYMRRAREERARAVAELFGFVGSAADAKKIEKPEPSVVFDLAVAKAA